MNGWASPLAAESRSYIGIQASDTWYDLPAWYGENREAVLAANEGYVFAGYREQARRFLLKTKDAPVHPYVEAEAG